MAYGDGGELAARRHRARQVRACIVEFAREYKEACRQHDRAASAYQHGEIELDMYERLALAVEWKQEALFCALEELEGLEEEDRP